MLTLDRRDCCANPESDSTGFVMYILSASADDSERGLRHPYASQSLEAICVIMPEWFTAVVSSLQWIKLYFFIAWCNFLLCLVPNPDKRTHTHTHKQNRYKHEFGNVEPKKERMYEWMKERKIITLNSIVSMNLFCLPVSLVNLFDVFSFHAKCDSIENT